MVYRRSSLLLNEVGGGVEFKILALPPGARMSEKGKWYQGKEKKRDGLFVKR